jgi:DNA replication protein DnaC
VSLENQQWVHQQREAQANRWMAEFIPRSYQDSKLERLPDQEATRLLFEFDPTMHEGPPIGAFLYGQTGSGKTRSLIMFLRILQLRTGDDVCYRRGKALGDEIIERTRPNGRGGFEKWFKEIKTVDALAIDEVDKISFSPRVLAEFFELIEHRTSEDLSTYFIAQCSIDRLGDKMGPKAREEAAGIVRRIKENCLPIHFSKP